MSDPAVHIAAWEAEGLIDASLAERLRQAGRPAPAVGSSSSPSSIGSFFGPSPTIGELFGYLGVAFLIGAWTAFLVRVAGSNNHSPILGAGTALAAAVMIGLGVRLMGGDARQRRAAGVSFVAATALAAGAAEFVILLMSIGGTTMGGLIVAGAAAVVAASLRWTLPAVTTQIGLLGSLTGLAAATLSVLQEAFDPPFDGFNGNDPDPLWLVLVSGAAWLLVALGLGVLGLREARAAAVDPPAARRAIVTRFWAGLVAVIGLTTSLTRTGVTSEDGGYGRLLEPWIADVAILVLVAVLVERAFRRDTTVFIVAAAIALIAALTDFNFTYLSQSTDVGLLIEGAILLSVGFVGDRLRRRMDRSGDRVPVVETA
jgi:hypothetical protein